MVKVETSIIIHRPIEEVFAYVSDFRNSPQWQAGIVEVRQTPESPVGRGTRVTFLRTFLGRKIEGTSEMVEYEPPTKHTFKSTSGPLPITVSRIFEPTVEGTKVTIVLEMQPGGVFALAEPLIARSLRRDVEADFGNLKDLLESRVAAATS
ncbi:MAG TPA: SRPBCC family protein [Ktedonobacteraceae bacterium]